MPPRVKALVSWSSGKDSAFAVHVARRGGSVEVIGALTTITAGFDRVSMHGVRETLLDRQMEELGLACIKVRIPSPCPNEIYEREMTAALRDAQGMGVTHVVFGDLFLADIRAYREARLKELGMQGVFPLWNEDTGELARRMIAEGMRAMITCVDLRKLDASYAGRTFDQGFVATLPAGVDPCGENGEFHSFATAGPMFTKPIEVRLGEVIERDGFVFADLSLT